MAHPKVHETSSLQELVQLKENEWKEAQELRNSSLQAALQEKDRQLNNEKLRFRKLKEDFGYNLKLLEERDQELQRYDALFSQFRNVNSLRDGEVSDLKIQLDDLKLKLSHEEKAKEELQRHYQQRLREHQQELNQFRLQKETEVKKEREELECFKRELQTQLRAAEEDVETQRQELMAGFDDALRKREHEFRKKADDMSNSLLASDLKVRMLTKELELLRANGDRAKDELESTETAVHDLEKQLKQKAWEITDAQSMNSAKVAELEAQIEQLKTTMNKAQERFQHKHAELDRYAKEKEQTLIASKQSHIEHERSLEEKIRVLQNQLETEQVECRRLLWAHKDAEKEHGLELHRLQGIIADLESKLDKQATESARSTVARDLELEALRQQGGKMRMEIAQHKENTDRYKKELAMAVERESCLERSKDQLEVDWQRRCEDTEREVYNKQEQLITGLTKARDEAKALAQDRQRELLQRDDLIRMLTQSRDQAVVTLQRHGLSIPSELPSKESREKLSSLSTYGGGAEDTQDLPPDEKIKVLQQQNANLREVIGQMRHDMEELSNQLASRPPSVMVRSGENQEETSVPLTTEYVESLEKEIKELKSKNRSLRDQIDDLSQSAKPPVGYSRGATRPHGSQTQDAFIQAHIRELNVTIGALRQEKLELSAQAKKHQATVDHVQGLLNQAYEEVRQKQLTVDQLQYELTTQGRRSADQESVFKQRVTELELQLAQTRREADEYFKSGLETNAQATSLGNQLSTLKVELASQGRGASSFNPQTTVVKQLQDEIRHLRKQLTSGIDHRSKPVSLPDGRDVTQLHMKLQAAVRRISGLTQEKEQLIQMGNRLRAELTKYTGGRRSAPPGPISIEPSEPLLNRATVEKPYTSRTPGEMKDHLQGQLSVVEKLQYQLTSHELQFAQRMAQQQAAEQVKVTVVSSSAESNEEGKAPQLPTEPRDLVTRDSDTKNMDPMDDPVTHQSTTQRTSSPLDGQQPLFTSSSEGQASLQEIWKMLDEEERFRSPTPHKTHPRSPRQPATSRDLVPDHIPARNSPERDVFTVKGKRTDVENKPATQRPVLSKKAAGKAKSTPKKLRVRNYNIRDNT